MPPQALVVEDAAPAARRGLERRLVLLLGYTGEHRAYRAVHVHGERRREGKGGRAHTEESGDTTRGWIKNIFLHFGVHRQPARMSKDKDKDKGKVGEKKCVEKGDHDAAETKRLQQPA